MESICEGEVAKLPLYEPRVIRCSYASLYCVTRTVAMQETLSRVTLYSQVEVVNSRSFISWSLPLRYPSRAHHSFFNHEFVTRG